MDIQSYLLIFGFLEIVFGICPLPHLAEDPTKKKCYFVSTFQTSWKEAKFICESCGATLAKVEDNIDHEFLVDHIITDHAYWIGMNDGRREASYFWTDNTPVTWTLWKSDQPNGGRNENCVIYDTNQQWQDYACGASFYFLCQIDRISEKNSQFRKVDKIVRVAVLRVLQVPDSVTCVGSCVKTTDCGAVVFNPKATSNNCQLLKAGGDSEFFSPDFELYQHSSFRVPETIVKK